MATVQQKINCKYCMAGKCQDCINPDCLCRESHNKSESLRDGVHVYPEQRITYEQLKEIAREQERTEPKVFRNDQFDLVAELIQNENHFVTLRETKEIWWYDRNEGIYKPLGHTIIEESCQRMIQKCNKRTVTEVIETIRRNGTYIHSKDLLESRHINTQNGILDSNTFELYPHSPEYLTTTKLPFSVNPQARNLKLWNHILTIIDVKDIHLIMELIWMCISWNNPFKKMFVFKGEPNTLKSTLAEILVWIIGRMNVSIQRPQSFLKNDSRFGTSHFIGKRMNIASEIGNLSGEMLENLKALVGAEPQNTERKNDNTERTFDPAKFVFLFTTNKLGEIYSSINDNSVITRFQFLIFRNKINDVEANGQWYDEFFKNEEDKQSAIDTLVNIVINYKKAQSQGIIPKTKWSSIDETKRILKEEMSKEDKYFENERIVPKEGSKLTLQEIKSDFESFVGYSVNPQQMGIILKKHGILSKQSHGISYYAGWNFASAKEQGQTEMGVHFD